MNELTESQGTQLVSASELIRNPDMMGQFNALAEILSSSSVTVPKHLQKSPGDCFAIVMQAAQWGMNPFSVAQKTHIVNGVLGYEAQLVNAVIQSSGAIHGRFHYEYKGEESNLACRVGAVIKGETDITWGEWLEKNKVATQNSPLWKTNPKQQLSYLQIKNWARLYCPGAILGVYSEDELQEIPTEKIINPIPKEKTVVYCTDESFAKNASAWRKKVELDHDPEKLISFLRSKYELTDTQKNTIYSWGTDTCLEGELA